jgi:hypothetical protein
MPITPAARGARARLRSPVSAKPATPEPSAAKLAAVNNALAVTPRDYQDAQRVLVNYSANLGRTQAAGSKGPNGAWTRGVLQAKQERVATGSLITVYSGHSKPTDKFFALKLRMQATLPGRSYPQQFDLIKFGTGGPVSTAQGTGAHQFESVLKYHVTDQALEAAIAKVAPSVPVKDLLTNGQFAVHGNWDNQGRSGHNWGDFDRHGIFPLTLASGVTVKAEPQIIVGLPPNQTNVQLDVSVPISAARKKKFPALDTKHAIFVSHLEAEGKARVPLTRFRELNDRSQKLASTNTAADMKQIFGAEARDWHVERVKKYDPKGVSMKPDKYGLLPVNPFIDVYLDNASRDLATNYIALRMRKVAGEKNNFTQINYKPGPGIRDAKTNVARRVESELIVRQEVARNPDMLLPLFNDAGEPLNPHNLGNEYVRQATGRTLPASINGQPGSRITQFSGIGSNRRYKFEQANKKTLVAFEASLDLCATLALDARGMPLRVDKNGVPDAKGDYFAVSVFGQIEPEANHMAGVVGGAASPKAPAGPEVANAVPITQGAAAPAGQVGPPSIHIHGLKDLNSSVFTTDPGYVQFDKVMPDFQQWLFSGKVGDRAGAYPTEQKNAIGQRLAGTIPMTPQEKQLYAQELEATRQFREKGSVQLRKLADGAEKKIVKAAAAFGGKGPKYEAVLAKEREAMWEAFGKLNPLDFIDMKSLPAP